MCSHMIWHTPWCQQFWGIVQTDFKYSILAGCRRVSEAICTNQVTQMEKLNDSFFSWNCSLISVSSVSCTILMVMQKAILPLPLWESRLFLPYFWPQSWSWAGGSGGQIGNIYLGLQRDWEEAFRVFLSSGMSAGENHENCINTKVNEGISVSFVLVAIQVIIKRVCVGWRDDKRKRCLIYSWYTQALSHFNLKMASGDHWKF